MFIKLWWNFLLHLSISGGEEKNLIFSQVYFRNVIVVPSN